MTMYNENDDIFIEQNNENDDIFIEQDNENDDTFIEQCGSGPRLQCRTSADRARRSWGAGRPERPSTRRPGSRRTSASEVAARGRAFSTGSRRR